MLFSFCFLNFEEEVSPGLVFVDKEKANCYCRFCCSADWNPLLVAEAGEVMNVHSPLFYVTCLPTSFHLMRAVEEEIHTLHKEKD